MLMVISPAKTLDYESPAATPVFTQPEHLKESRRLIARLRKLDAPQVSNLMTLSDKLAALNVARYAQWKPPFTPHNAKQALLAFAGDVYDGVAAEDFSEREFEYVQARLRILSGLYGVLRPLDLMQPYRLEMGTRLATERGSDLYAFWGSQVTSALNRLLATDKVPVLINLASEEYFGVVQPQEIKARIVTPVFEDWNATTGKFKIISFHAKKARGMMVRYASKHRLTNVEKLKQFDAAGYVYTARASSADRWVFRRPAAA